MEKKKWKCTGEISKKNQQKKPNHSGIIFFVVVLYMLRALGFMTCLNCNLMLLQCRIFEKPIGYTDGVFISL